MPQVKSFFTESQKDGITAAIKKAEKETSGEIRVHLESTCKIDVLVRAAEVFADLKMHKTKLKNGILFYLSVDDRKFAIIGDKGIHKYATDSFWTETRNLLLDHFKKEQFYEGLCESILKAGDLLHNHFPYNKKTDKNELSDEISFKD
jgi:uncharacterized membrane protein